MLFFYVIIRCVNSLPLRITKIQELLISNVSTAIKEHARAHGIMVKNMVKDDNFIKSNGDEAKID